MKVIQCIHSMGGGGAERQLAYLSAPLSKRGWSVVTILVEGGVHLPRLIDGGARIEWLRHKANHDPRLVLELRRIIAIEHPDIVHTWLPQMDIAAGIASVTSGVPWVMSERSSGDAFRGTWKQRLRLVVAKRAAAIVANSAGGARFWASKVAPRPVRVIANALDVDAIDRAGVATLEEMGVPPGRRIVLAAGRCVPEKNQRLLIEALRHLGPDVVLVICGEGPLLEDTRTLAANLGVAERVIFAGYVESVWSWMKRADVFASIGWYEGHPNAVLEAMAARCPVVLSDIEAHRDVLRPDEALFVDPSSAEELAGAIRTMLAGESVAERVERARERAETFSIEASGAAYDAFFREVIAARRARR